MNKTCCTIFLMCLLCLFFFSCANNSIKEKTDEDSKKVDVPKRTIQKPCVKIYCYGNVSNAKSELLASELKKYYPKVELARQHVGLPEEYYHQGRNRYNGSGMLKDLRRLKKDAVVLGVTDEVIYQTNNISSTFGIFGLSTVGAHVALISLTQPSGKKHSDDHIVKLMLHELGHAFGLKHCSDEHCLMVNAEHRNKFSQTPSFCKNCKLFLNKKGWKL